VKAPSPWQSVASRVDVKQRLMSEVRFLPKVCSNYLGFCAE
jgi:hypothetical protein